MPIRLDDNDADFSRRFSDFLGVKREAAEDVEQKVRHILAEVKAYGDRALLQLTLEFDRLDLAKTSMRVSSAEIDAAEKSCEPRALAALELARERIEAYHVRQKPADTHFTDALGVEMGARWTAIEAVGLYVPGGTAAYPSSVLMNAVPAKVAGCARLVMVVPAPDGKLSPLVLAAAKLAGVDEIYRIGGAQAVAALAYGTETIAPVAKIVGPGNAYVAAAKRQVFGQVGIDMIAGPSEVLILADKTGNADWIAADLLAQAEHDTNAQSILITDDKALADAGRESRRGATQNIAAREYRRRLLARFRRHHHRRQARRRRRAGRSPGARASGDRRRPRRKTFPPHPQRRRHLHRRPYAGSHRRLCRRLQPRAADRALGAFLLGPRRARFHEAHLAAQVRPRAVARAGTIGHRARRGGGPCRARAFGRHPPQPEMTSTKAPPAAMKQRLASVTLDEESIGRSNPDVEHEREVAIYDLLEQNTFAPIGHEDSGPFALHLSITGSRLVFDIRREGRQADCRASVLALAFAPDRQGLLHDL